MPDDRLAELKHRLAEIPLAPCPFCGAHPALQIKNSLVGIKCGGTICSGSGLIVCFSHENAETAITVWNLRAHMQTSLRELDKRLSRRLDELSATPSDIAQGAVEALRDLRVGLTRAMSLEFGYTPGISKPH